MGGVVADQLQRLFAAAGDDGNLGVAGDHKGEIAQHAVDPHRQRLFGEALADRGRDFGAAHRTGKRPLGAIGQGDDEGGSGGFVR